MKLKSVSIVVKDIEKAQSFYHDLFEPDVAPDKDEALIEVGIPV